MSRRAFTARVARRTLLRSRRHAALVVLTIAVPVAAATAASTIVQSLQLTPLRQLEATIGPAAEAFIDAYERPGIEQSPAGTVRQRVNLPAVDPPTPDDYETALAAALGPDHELHRVAVQLSRLATDERRARDGVHMLEVELGIPEIAAAFPLASGRLPERAGEVLIDQALADGLDLAVGMPATVTPSDGGRGAPGAAPLAADVSIVGVVAPIAGMTDRLAAVGLPGTALATPEHLWGGASLRWFVTGAPVTWDDVLAVNAVGSSVLSRAVITDPPPAEQVSWDDSQPLTGEEAQLATIGGLLGVMVLALLVAPAFAVGAQRSRRELGMLAATGAGRRELRRVVVSQGVVAGLVAAAVGVVVGLVAAVAVRLVAGTLGSVALPDLRVPWVPIAVVAVVGVLAPIGAAWWPARIVTRDDPLAAITGRTVAAAVRPRRRRIGALVLLLVGVLGSVGGVVTAAPVILAAGAFVLFVACLLWIGPLVGVIARASRRVGTSARYALRDADRRRSRTVPAIAGVFAAVALAVAIGGFSASHYAHAVAAWAAPSGPGTVRVSIAERGSSNGSWGGAVDADTWQRAATALAGGIALDGPAVAVFVGTGVGDGSSAEFYPRFDLTPFGEISAVVRGDRSHTAKWANPFPLIDDGTVVGQLGVPGAAAAAEALAAGRMVVWSPALIDGDGNAHVEVDVAGRTRAADVPATAVDLGTRDYFTIFSPQLAATLGLERLQVGLVATLDTTVDVDAENALRATLDAVIPGAQVAVERGPTADGAAVSLVFGVLAVLIVIAAAAACIALASADARPDLATLAAVGAPARVRRGIAATTGALIVAVGVLLGTVIGLTFAAALVVVRRYGGDDGVDLAWRLQIPWPLLGALVVLAPAVVLAGAWLLTPRRLPLTRRLT